jgi:hypothetical protein
VRRSLLRGRSDGRVRKFCRRGERSFWVNVAAEQKISEEQALQVGLEQKAKEFKEAGAQVYAKA